MDGVKVPLGNRGMTVEAEWQWSEGVETPGTYVIEWVHAGILLGPVFFRTAVPCSGGYHMEDGGMPLHDVVGIICEKGATTEN